MITEIKGRSGGGCATPTTIDTPVHTAPDPIADVHALGAGAEKRQIAGKKTQPEAGPVKPSVWLAASRLLDSLGMTRVQPASQAPAPFKRENLPSPQAFWAAQGISLPVENGWITVKCVFHEDRHASLGIHTETGGFFCHACGAKGGDVLAAFRLLNNCSFVTAAQALGAWEEN